MRIPRHWARSILAAAALSAFGCGGDMQPTDGNPSNDVAMTDATVTDTAHDTGAPTDTRTDGAPSDGGTLFGPCTQTSDCPGPTPTCIRVSQGYPGGTCSRRCTGDSQCGPNGTCQPFGSMMLCFQTCSFGADCRAGYNCFTFTNAPDVQACLPLCNDDSQCPGGHCDVYTGFCGTTDTTLADNGGTCMISGDCRSGRCTPEIDAMGQPTGSLDGICYSLCTVPPDADYAGATLPRGGCAANSVCSPARNSGAGDIGFCRLECTTASDCRDGYICVHPNRTVGSGTYTNGYCAAMNCHYMTQTCPPIATCQTTASDGGVPVNGVCVRNSTDGGADTGTDATPSDAPGDITSDIVPVDADDAADASIAD